MTTTTTLYTAQGHLSPTPRVHYVYHKVDVPPAASKVGLRFSFHKKRLAQLFISMYDPNGFRGNRMNPGAKGDVTLELWVTPDDASPGGVPGVLTPGEWTVQIDVEALGEETDYDLMVYAEQGEVASPVAFGPPQNVVIRAEAGWYRGELHAHSTESDGKKAVETVLQAAVDTGLDFFALTDHFTVSQWRKMGAFVDKLALLPSLEVTSHHGHANLHGMTEWIDNFPDRDDWSMNDIADTIHAQGGLFCVNHAFSGRLGWRAYDFDWAKADLMEAYHNLESLNNVYQVGLWDRLLTAGHRIVGVAGIDSHDPFDGLHKLGQLVTWVYADELSQAAIIDGLRRGRVYLSKGPQLRFLATSGDASAEMWETLSIAPGSTAQFELQVITDETLRMAVYRDGLFFDDWTIEPDADNWQTVSFEDAPTKRSYYRVELHAPLPGEDKPWMLWRDHTTMRAFTNPVWVEPTV